MQRKILIVDDSESIRELVKMTLEEAGYEVHIAENGQEGCSILNKVGAVDLIITDLHMPIMDGIGLISEVRTNSTVNSRVPILFLTTETQADKKMEAKNAGATGWIIKPFIPKKLLSAVQKVLR